MSSATSVRQNHGACGIPSISRYQSQHLARSSIRCGCISSTRPFGVYLHQRDLEQLRTDNPGILQDQACFCGGVSSNSPFGGSLHQRDLEQSRLVNLGILAGSSPLMWWCHQLWYITIPPLLTRIPTKNVPVIDASHQMKLSLVVLPSAVVY